MIKVVKAFEFALERHSGQLRKDGSTPYIVHPFRVFMFLADKAKIYDETVLAAAFLHDLIEDTKTDYDELQKEFGKDIANIVAVLSKDKRLPEKTRERSFNGQLEHASWKAKVIKLADIYDNVLDIKNWKMGSRSEKISLLKEKCDQMKFLRKNIPIRYEQIVKRVLSEINQMQKHMGQQA